MDGIPLQITDMMTPCLLLGQVRPTPTASQRAFEDSTKVISPLMSAFLFLPDHCQNAQNVPLAGAKGKQLQLEVLMPAWHRNPMC